MPDAVTQVNDLKGMPDQALQMELMNPSGAVPAYLVLAEAQRRQLMRQSAVTQQNQAPVGSVYDDVIRSMMARQPPQGAAPAGMTPPPAAPPAAPQTPQNFRPPQGMAEGGEVDDDDYADDEEGGDDDILEMPLKPTGAIQPIKPAGRQPLVQRQPMPARRPTAYDEEIESAGKHYNVDPNLARAVIGVESAGHNGLVSPKGAMGLMQLMPGTAAGLGVTDPQDPHQNIWGGTHYLKEMIDRYGGDIPRALAAYNAGPGKIQRGGEIPLYAQSYVNNVMKRYKGFGGASAPDAEALAATPATPRPPAQPFTSPDDWRAQQLAALQTPSASAPGAAAVADDPQLATILDSGSPSPGAAPAPTAVEAAPSTDPFDPANLRKSRDVYSDVIYGQEPPLTASQKELRQRIQKMWDEAEARKKPNFWKFLENFGLGMASTPSRNWGQSLAGGAAGMAKGFAAQQDDARKQELELMGISSKLDDEMRVEQGKIGDAVANQARIKAEADRQAAQQHDQVALKMPGAMIGDANVSPGGGYIKEPLLNVPGKAVWHLGVQAPVTQEIQPYLETNPATGQRPAVGSMLPTMDVETARQKWLMDQQKTLGKTPTTAEQVWEVNAQALARSNKEATTKTGMPIDWTQPVFPQLAPQWQQKAMITPEQQTQAEQLKLSRQTAENARNDKLRLDNYDKRIGDFNKLYTPIKDKADRVDTLLHNLDTGIPAADAMAIPQLLVTEVSGAGSGVRLTQPEINNVLGARSTWGDLQAKIQKFSQGGDPLTDDQKQMIRDLVGYLRTKTQAKMEALQFANHRLDEAKTPDIQNGAMTQLREELNTIEGQPYSMRDDKGKLHTFSTQQGLNQFSQALAKQKPAAAAAPATGGQKLVQMIAPDGKTGSVPENQVEAARKQGYKLPGE